MKKFLLFICLFTCSLVFAENYTVKSVKGKVQFEVSPNKFEDVKVGQTLSDSTVVNTGVNSTIIITLNDKEFTIKPMQKGTVENVKEGKRTGLSKGGKKVDTTHVAEAEEGRTAVSTASSRASEAKEDYDWDD